jgi:hypothetical protein
MFVVVFAAVCMVAMCTLGHTLAVWLFAVPRRTATVAHVAHVPAAAPRRLHPIDLVVTWVRVDAALVASMVRTGGRTTRMNARAFPTDTHVMHLLGCARRNMPWLRRIHVLTNGQVPLPLQDAAHPFLADSPGTPQVRIATHADTFGAAAATALPTFNSCAIEMTLHRIPGLSEAFLYANDDMIPIQPSQPDDWFVGVDLPDGVDAADAPAPVPRATTVPSMPTRWISAAAAAAAPPAATPPDVFKGAAGRNAGGVRTPYTWHGSLGSMTRIVASAMGSTPRAVLDAMPAHSILPHCREFFRTMEQIFPVDVQRSAHTRYREDGGAGVFNQYVPLLIAAAIDAKLDAAPSPRGPRLLGPPVSVGTVHVLGLGMDAARARAAAAKSTAMLLADPNAVVYNPNDSFSTAAVADALISDVVAAVSPEPPRTV